MKIKNKVKLKKAKNGSIRIQLTISFVVPILLLILLGTVSYCMAAVAIQNNYTASTTKAISMAGEYMNFGLDAVENTSIQYINDDEIINYFSKLYKNDKIKQQNAKNAISNMLEAQKGTDDFIDNIYLLSDNTISTVSGLSNSVYSDFQMTESGQFIINNRTKNLWVGKDQTVDKSLNTIATGYSLRMIRSLQKTNGAIIIDVQMDTIQGILKDLNFSKSGYLSLVTEDGKEISADDINKSVFSGTDFYKSALKSKEKNGSEYVSLKDKKYLFMFTKIGDSGAMICALMPKNVITGQADNIKLVTQIIVMLACLIAVVIGFFISNGINVSIKRIMSALKKASSGDLTVLFETKRRDEFRTLFNELSNTFANMKELILQVKLLSGSVLESSEQVEKTSVDFVKLSENITSAIREVEQGVTQQARDSQDCLTEIDDLSQKLIRVNDNTKDISRITGQTRQSIEQGTQSTKELNEQMKVTIDKTTAIVKKMGEQANNVLSIGRITKDINEIANQINLLSLNASIEAARAGQYGGGFAVVADEIRKLAEQSKATANTIFKDVEGIRRDAMDTMKSAQEVEEVLHLQEKAVFDTTQSYQSIHMNVDELVHYQDNIISDMESIDRARENALSSIESISAVLEEVAASSNTVSEASSQQLGKIENLNTSAEALEDNADKLIKAIEKFTI